MPANPRVRADNVQGTVTDNPLTNAATTMNSAGLANLPAVSSQHAVLVLDPLRSAGAPEIVIVTAHTGAATSATITRGAYGTSARQHASGTLWVHAPTVEDFIRIVAASSDITDPYRGQLAYDRVLDKFIARNQSDVWQDVVALGAWVSWTPTLTNLTLGNGTSSAAYIRVGRTVVWRWKFTLGSTSAVGSDPQFTLPVAPAAAYSGQDIPLGEAALADQGVATYEGFASLVSGSTCRVQVINSAGTYAVRNTVTATAPHTWGNTDAIWAWGAYEAAS